MAPALRLYQAEDDGQPAAHWTLSRFYRDWFVAQHERVENLKATTHDTYARSIRYWAEFTGDPPLAAIDAEVVAAFLEKLRGLPVRRPRLGENADALPRITKRTVAKHCRHVQLVLDRAGPWSSRAREALGLLERVPTVKRKVRGKLTPKPAYALVELEQLIQAGASMPAPVTRPGLWWASLLLSGYLLGFRIGTLVAMRFEWLEADDEITRVYVPEEASKQDGGLVREVPADLLAIWRRLHAEACAPGQGAPHAGLIHPWPHTAGWLQAQRRRLCRAAGVRNLGFHGLRRLHGTGLAKGDLELARKSLGHASTAVTTGSYVEAREIALGCASLPRVRLDRVLPGGQRALFDKHLR